MSDSMPMFTFRKLLENKKMVVPEIQREYVWGKDHSILQKFIESITIEDKGYNIGFLYSYTPHYADKKDEICYLIDGQQRFTTLYLLAFYYAIKEGRKEEFNKISVKFSYRVRVSTAGFLEKIVKKITDISEFQNMKEQTWFLSHYHKDPSVDTMLAFYKWLTELEHCDNSKLTYDKIMEVSFFNFNIDETGQGEELYITMNSRGEQLQANETLRANLLGHIEQSDLKQTSGKTYDKWQDFFWKHRGKNLSADKGFDEFIRWIIAITTEKFVLDDKSNNYIKSMPLQKYFDILNFEKIKKYFDTLGKIINDFEKNDLENTLEIKKHYKDWLIGKISNRGYMFILPILSLLTNNTSIKIDDVNFKRWSRFFYNIAFNKGSVAIKEVLNLSLEIKITDIVDLINENGKPVITNNLLDEEECTKLQRLKFSKEREELEKVFQKLEDHPILAGCIKPFIDHSLDDKGILNLAILTQYQDIFYQCFPIGKYGDELNSVRRALLACRNYNDPDETFALWESRTDNLHHQHRYSFCDTLQEWKESYKDKKDRFFVLLTRCINDESLNTIIDQYNNIENCFYTVIKSKDLLKYAKNKCFTFDWGNNKIGYILRKTRYSYIGYKDIGFFDIGLKYDMKIAENEGYCYNYQGIDFYLYYNCEEYLEQYSLWTKLKNQQKLKDIGFESYNKSWLVIFDMNTEQGVLDVIQKIKDHII